MLPLGRVYRTSSRCRERRYDADAADALAVWRDRTDDTVGRPRPPGAASRRPGGGPGRRTRRAPRAGRPRGVAPAHVDRGDRLRWSVRIAAHPGPRGDDWGDTFFARDLAAALRSLGQDVVVDHRESHVRPFSEHLDDVAPDAPRPRRHPGPPAPHQRALGDLAPRPGVRRPSSRRYDLRFAAGPVWAARVTGGDRAGCRAPAAGDGPGTLPPGTASTRPFPELDTAVRRQDPRGLPAGRARRRSPPVSTSPSGAKGGRHCCRTASTAASSCRTTGCRRSTAAPGWCSTTTGTTWRATASCRTGCSTRRRPAPSSSPTRSRASRSCSTARSARTGTSRSCGRSSGWASPPPTRSAGARGARIGAEHSFVRRAETLLDAVRRERARR